MTDQLTPSIERLTNRLANLPPVFRSPLTVIQLEAVVADLFRDRATRALDPAEVARFRPGEGDAATRVRHLELVLIACWVLHDEAFAGAPAEALLGLLEVRLPQLAGAVVPRLFVEEAERREELVRTCLAVLGRLPEGETTAQAEDRLAVLDSVRRRELLREAREREQERQRRKDELARLRAQEEEAARQAARTTHED